MNIENIKKLDLYKCSLQDINLAYKWLKSYKQYLINNGKAHPITDKWIEVSKLFVLVARAKSGADKDGYMLEYNINLDRLPNDKSVLKQAVK